MLISLNKWKWLRICLKKLMVTVSFIEKTYVVGIYWNSLKEAIAVCTYNICYWEKDNYLDIYTCQVPCTLFLPLLNLPICQSELKYLWLYCKLFILAWQLYLFAKLVVAYLYIAFPFFLCQRALVHWCIEFLFNSISCSLNKMFMMPVGHHVLHKNTIFRQFVYVGGHNRCQTLFLRLPLSRYRKSRHIDEVKQHFDHLIVISCLSST